ncbi:MAG: AAA family ATPase [Pseudomonadota bacterium]
MAQRLTFKPPFFELTSLSGHTVVTSLAFPEAVALGESPRRVAQRLAKAAQTHWVDQGFALEALQWLDAPALERRDVVVEFPEGKQPLLQPAWRCRHAVFMTADDAPRGLAFVPALGVVAIAPPERLLEAVIEAVRLETRRRGRRAQARLQVAAQWFEQVEASPQSLELVFHSAEELRRLQAEQAVPLLRSVAHEMQGGLTAVGLQASLEALQRATEGRFSGSVLVVGAEGSGKTTLIQHHARQSSLRCFQTSAGRLIQGLTGNGGWQPALARLCNELQEQEVVLCVGHLVELFEVGQYEGNALSLGDGLREPVARGRVCLIAEATPAELATLELRSPGLVALFQQVRLPDTDAAAQAPVVLQAVASLAQANRLTVAPAVVSEVLALQRRFSPYAGFPGKAIRFFEALILHGRGRHDPALSRDDAYEAFCAETGMPRRLLDPDMPLDLAEIKDFFQRRLFGQPEVIDVLLGVLASVKTGLARTGQPIASLLLIGPTGVGKTETAKALAEFMFGDARRMIRLDMSEYADPGATLRLLGDLGGGEEGTLLGAVRRQPFSVVLLDELEKADASFFDLLLQVLGEGRLTSGNGLTANFCGTIVLMTSNLGAQALQQSPMGLVTRQDDPRRHFEQAVQAALRPELFNRIDHMVPFAPLSGAQRVPIFEREIGLVRRREGLLERALTLQLDPTTAAHLAALPADARYGARDMQRVLRRELLLPLAHAVAPYPGVQPLAVHLAPAAMQGAGAALSVRTEVLPRVPDGVPLRMAEATAQARRLWHRVANGPLYVHLLNELFRLGHERQRHDKQRVKKTGMPHWDETAAAARQRALAALRESFEAQRGEILALEDLALQALMGERSEAPALAPWEERFAALKREVFHTMRPQSGVCTVGVYGPPAVQATLLAAWSGLAALAGFTVQVQVVWLRDPQAKPTPAALRPKNSRDDDDADAAEREAKEGDDDQPPPAYLRELWPLPPGKTLPPQAVVVGHELELRGSAVYDYLRAEGGLWRLWQGERKVDTWVAVHNQTGLDFQTPAGVHRRLFFNGLPVHRQVKQGQLSDGAGDWRVLDWPHAPLWRAQLDRQMAVTVDQMLLGDDTALLQKDGA